MEINLKTLLWIGAALLLLLLLHNLQPILGPFFLAVLFAYLGDPLVDRLEQRKLSRTWAVVVVFLLMTLLAALFVLILVPMLAAQIDLLREVFPGYLAWFKASVLPYLYSALGVEQNDELLEKIQLLLANNWQRASDLLLVFVAKASQSGMAIVAFAGSVALIPVVTFYLLRDWDILISHFQDLLPRKNLPVVQQLARECDEVLGAFLRGQLLIMICLGLVYTIGLFMLGLELGLLVGMIAGIASIVPYLGALLGIVAATVAVMVQFQDPIYLLGVAAVFTVGQLLESLILTPLLVGDKIGLHPVAVIFAVMAGGQLFGFVGVLLALPVAAVLMVVLRHAHHNYRNSIFYHS